MSCILSVPWHSAAYIDTGCRDEKNLPTVNDTGQPIKTARKEAVERFDLTSSMNTMMIQQKSPMKLTNEDVLMASFVEKM